MKRRLLLFLWISLCAPVFAADAAKADEKAVLAVVQRLFDAMAARDGAAARAVLLPGGSIVQVRDNAPTPGVSPQAEFPDRIAKAAAPSRERIWDPTVLVHGSIAQVWAPYDFHRGETFSHCGVDSISLVKTGEGWKIAGLTYTVETTGCAPPKK